MSTFLALAVLFLLLVGVTALIEHTHRRTGGMPRLPLGADAGRDSDLARTWHDLDVLDRRPCA